jgi:hypothetical protein
MCFFGIASRVIQQQFFKSNPDDMKVMSCRFTSHVFPGETLLVKAWKEGDTILFSTSTKERSKDVLQGYIKAAPNAKL